MHVDDLRVQAKQKRHPPRVVRRTFVGVGGVYGFVELLVGFAQGWRHGQGVVEVGQRCFGEAGAGVQDGLGGGFDGGALFLACGLGGCGAGGLCGGRRLWQLGPREVVVGIPGDRDRSFRRIVTDDSDLS